MWFQVVTIPMAMKKAALHRKSQALPSILYEWKTI
jgi:hypothetical protein